MDDKIKHQIEYCKYINKSIGQIKPWPEYTKKCYICKVELIVPSNYLSTINCLAEDYNNQPYYHSCKYSFCEEHRENHNCIIKIKNDKILLQDLRLFRINKLGLKEYISEGVIWKDKNYSSEYYDIIPLSKKRIEYLKEKYDYCA